MPLLGFPIELALVAADEQPFEGEPALDTAVRLAEAKALAATPPRPGEVVVGADTVVVLGSQQLGKPTAAEDARRMLVALRTRAHEVITGIALRSDGPTYRGTIRTTVRMRPYSDEQLERYVRSGRPLDKAGAYAIQDHDFAPVERIEGCYLNVVGLPLCEISRGLRKLGWSVAEERLDPPCRLCRVGQAKLEREAR